MFSASRLIAFRQARGWSQAELAREAGVSHTYIQNLERGDVRLPKQPYLEKIARALGVEPGDLLELPGGERTPAPSLTPPYANNPAITEIVIHLMKLGELDQSRVESLLWIVEAVVDKEARDHLESERRRKAWRRNQGVGNAGNGREG